MLVTPLWCLLLNLTVTLPVHQMLSLYCHDAVLRDLVAKLRLRQMQCLYLHESALGE